MPKANVVHCHNMDQMFPELDYDDPVLWGKVVKEHMKLKDIDYIFASEDYGHTIGAQIDAQYVPVDQVRNSVPVSASIIRS